jgi:hypothetical protein
MSRCLFIKAAVCMIIAIAAIVSNSQAIEYINSLYWTAVYDVEVRDNYAYCCFDPGLVALDISNINEPVLVSRLYIPGENFNLQVFGDYAYVFGNRDKLRIIDIANPASPRLVSEIPINAEVDNIYVDDGYIYAAAGYLGMLIIDISDPYSPEIVSSFDTGGDTESIVVVDSLAYLAERFIYPSSYPFQIVNVADRRNPSIVSFISVDMGWNHDLVIDGNYAYLANSYEGLIIIDITDATNPTILTQIGGITYPSNLFKRGDYLFMDKRYDSLQVFDVTDPQLPVLTAACEIGAGAIDFDIAGDYLFVAGAYNGLPILDIADLGNIHQVSEYETPGATGLVFAVDNYLYADESGNSVNIHDLTDPEAPYLISQHEFPYGFYQSQISGDYLYLLGTGGVGIVDISVPSAPTEICYHTFDRTYIDICACDQYLYLTSLTEGVFVYERDAQDSLVYVRSFAWDMFSFDVEIENDIGYLMQAPSIYIFDFSNPADSVLLGSIAPVNGIGRICVHDAFIYVCPEEGQRSNSISIIDATDPTNPSHAGIINFPYVVLEAYIYDDLAYCTVYRYGLYIYDISNPYDPIFVGSFKTPGGLSGVYAFGNYAYVADNSSLAILRISPTDVEQTTAIPADFSISCNYPNPFNSSTIIGYSLPAPSEVKIDIYNILGQKVKTLLHMKQPAGHHQVVWHAENVPSGAYSYRLQAGNYCETGKMLFLK